MGLRHPVTRVAGGTGLVGVAGWCSVLHCVAADDGWEELAALTWVGQVVDCGKMESLVHV